MAEHELSFEELMASADACESADQILTFDEEWSRVQEDHRARVLRAVADLS